VDGPVRLHLTDAQSGYLAGIIDGEGYIGLLKTKATRYLLRVTVTSTSRELVDWLQTTTALGKVVFRDLSHRRRQNNYEWKVFGAAAGGVLRAALPYLVVKIAQATIALRYQENATLSGRERFEFAHQCSEMIKTLNLRRTWKQNVEPS
jgi:hypothetical protein